MTTKMCREHGVPKGWVNDKSSSRGGKWRCAECQRESSLKWKRNNPGASLVHRKNYVKKNIDSVKEYNKSYSIGWRVKNRERNKSVRTVYNKRFPGIRREQNARRRAGERSAKCFVCNGNGYYKAASGTCYVCLSHPATQTDHVMPLSRGGRHCEINFRGICDKCNTAKGAYVWPGHPDWHDFISNRRPGSLK